MPRHCRSGRGSPHSRKGTIAGQEAVVAQPLTYMNLSGQAVGS
ncbi:MAG: aminoacyl-tRNA hydrolase, partial [Oceanibaculum nanhaiense]|nr:aminoacyl-tRNA hydrolase [Oceanibaculum nanhaiense]